MLAQSASTNSLKGSLPRPTPPPTPPDRVPGRQLQRRRRRRVLDPLLPAANVGCYQPLVRRRRHERLKLTRQAVQPVGEHRPHLGHRARAAGVAVSEPLDEALALGALARELVGAPNRFGPLTRTLLRGLFVGPAALHLPENTLALHLLLERAKRLIDVVVTHEYLNQNDLLPPFGVPPGSGHIGGAPCEGKKNVRKGPLRRGGVRRRLRGRRA